VFCVCLCYYYFCNGGGCASIECHCYFQCVVISPCVEHCCCFCHDVSIMCSCVFYYVAWFSSVCLCPYFFWFWCFHYVLILFLSCFFEFRCVVMCIWLSTSPFLIYANIANIAVFKTLIQIQHKMFLKYFFPFLLKYFHLF